MFFSLYVFGYRDGEKKKKYPCLVYLYVFIKKKMNEKFEIYS